MSYTYKTKPFEHQLMAIQKHLENPCYGYFMDMGTGKTKTDIDVGGHLAETGAIDAHIIVAPKGVYRNWEGEILTHSGISNYGIYSWDGLTTKKATKYLHELLHGDKFKYVLMNVEAFSTKKGVDFMKNVLKFFGGKVNFSIDESTTIKNGSAQRTKSLLKLGELAKYRRVLTGNPIPNGLVDAWSQVQFLRNTPFNQKSFINFRNRYAIMKKMRVKTGKLDRFGNPMYREFEKVDSYKNHEEFKSLLAQEGVVIRKDDCLDLPPTTDIFRSFTPSEKMRMHYKTMKEFMLAEVGDELITVQNAIGRDMKLSQITSGFVQDGENVSVFSEERIEFLLDTLQEVSGKVIIFATKRKSIQQIVERLSKNYGEETVVSYYGDTKDYEREQAKRAFQDETSTVRFFVGNPVTAGYGLTLTACSYVVYYNYDYNLETYEQSRQRVHRIGQTKNVTYVHLLAEGLEVDKRMLDVLSGKKSLSDAVLQINWRDL